jgi:hypothetical protein
VARELAHVLESSGIEHRSDPLADRQLAVGMVSRDGLGAAALLGKHAAVLNFVEFGFPAHELFPAAGAGGAAI